MIGEKKSLNNAKITRSFAVLGASAVWGQNLSL